MKQLIILALLISSIGSFAQNKSTAVIIVPCLTGEIWIDGISQGRLEANDALNKNLTYGEHYIQLKAADNKFAKSIRVDDTFSEIIKLGCEAGPDPAAAVTLIDKTTSLRGALSNDIDNNIFGLDKDDELLISVSILNKKGKANISIRDYKTGREVFARNEFTTLNNERVKVPYKSVYIVSMYTGALFGKDASLLVKRIPSKNSKSNFNTAVKIVYDTTYEMVMDTKTRVYSTTNLSNPNKTTIPINLPANTAYCTFWIGVEAQSENTFKQFAATLSPALRVISINPVVLLGLKLIPELPAFKSPAAVVDYKFMSTKNSLAFVNDQAYEYYRIKYGNNISSDYSLLAAPPKDLVLGLTNNNLTEGRYVYIKVVAFIIKQRLVTDE